MGSYNLVLLQVHCHWNNHLKCDYRPWSQQDDILLLQSVKQFGLKSWAKIAERFEDSGSRSRTRCRQRFNGIFNLFKKNPENLHETLSEMDTNRNATKRRERLFDDLDKKFQDWITRIDEEPVVSNIQIAKINLEEETSLPNGTIVKNSLMSKFIRHIQTLLPEIKPKPLVPLPPPRLRTLPDQEDAIHSKPLNLSKLLRKKRVGRPNKMKPKREVTRVKLGLEKTTFMDREISRFLNPGFTTRQRRYKVNLSEEELGFINIAARNLDGILDFSTFKSNLSPEKINALNSGERQVLESYWFQSDITEAESPEAKKVRRTTYGRKSTDGIDGERSEKNVETEQTDLLMPTLASLRAFRGILLHADYTAELAREAEADPRALVRSGNAQKMLRAGVNNVDIIRRAKVGQTMFTPLMNASVRLFCLFILFILE